jgi:hypothetical protein
MGKIKKILLLSIIGFVSLIPGCVKRNLTPAKYPALGATCTLSDGSAVKLNAVYKSPIIFYGDEERLEAPENKIFLIAAASVDFKDGCPYKKSFYDIDDLRYSYYAYTFIKAETTEYPPDFEKSAIINGIGIDEVMTRKNYYYIFSIAQTAPFVGDSYNIMIARTTYYLSEENIINLESFTAEV